MLSAGTRASRWSIHIRSEIVMNRYTIVLSAAVLAAFSFTAEADVTSDAGRQVALHSGMETQARASKDFAMAAHCARLARENRAIAKDVAPTATKPTGHAALALAADQHAEAHQAMLRTATFSRDPGMAAHCRALIAQYTAEAAVHRELAQTSN
jgi:hypothetical protein